MYIPDFSSSYPIYDFWSFSTFLFLLHTRYNIRYGRVNATDAEEEDAAKAAEIHDRILTFPKSISFCML